MLGTLTAGAAASRTHGRPRANSHEEPPAPQMRPQPADTALAPRETPSGGLGHARLPAHRDGG